MYVSFSSQLNQPGKLLSVNSIYNMTGVYDMNHCIISWSQIFRSPIDLWNKKSGVVKDGKYLFEEINLKDYQKCEK